jgi:hypothetical protein
MLKETDFETFTNLLRFTVSNFRAKDDSVEEKL